MTQLHEKDVLTVKQAQISPNNLPDSKGAQVRMTNKQWQHIQMADPEISTIVSLLRKKKLSKRKGTAYDTDD